MNPRPPLSPHALDAEERALAKGLPRLHGRTAPGPDLDASILAAAQAAVQPARPARTSSKPRIRWIAPTSLAASMLLAVGMAWQLRPLPELKSAQAAAPVAEDSASEPVVVSTEPAASDQPLPMKVMPPAIAPAEQPARQQASATADSAQNVVRAQENRPAAAPVAPPPAPPPPASPPPLAAMAAKASPALDTQTGTSQTQKTQDSTRAREAAPAAAANASGMVQADTADKTARVSDSVRPAATSSRAAPVVPAQVRNEAAMAADAGFVDDPEEDIPPATAASPAVRDAWLRRITQLLEQGKQQDAKASLAEFKRRYPSAVLPPALKALDSAL